MYSSFRIQRLFKSKTFHCLLIAVALTLLLQALPTRLFLFPKIQVNGIYVYLIGMHCFLPMQMASIISLTVGVMLDLISGGYFGFYTLSFYVSLVALSTLKYVLKTIPLPLFIITVLTCSILKGTLETILIVSFIDPQGFYYINKNVLPEAILNAIFCPIVYLLLKGIFKNPSFSLKNNNPQ